VKSKAGRKNIMYSHLVVLLLQLLWIKHEYSEGVEKYEFSEDDIYSSGYRLHHLLKKNDLPNMAKEKILLATKAQSHKEMQI
jgi:hypothetical protein